MYMRKRVVKIMMAMAVVCAWMVVFAGIMPAAKLKNADKPFIDLGSEVCDSAPGHGGNTDTGLEGEVAESSEGEAVVTIRISIRGEVIMLNGNTVTEQQLPAMIRQVYEDGMEIYLVDNYADAAVYKRTLSMLKSSGYTPVLEQNE